MKHSWPAAILIVVGALAFGLPGASLGTAYGQPGTDTSEAETSAKDAREAAEALRAANETDPMAERLERSARSIDELVAKYKEATTEDQRRYWAELLGAAVQTAKKRAAEAKANLAPPNGTSGVERQVTLSPQEQVAQAEAFLARMEATRNSVRVQLETARTQRDVVKVLCLNDKFNQIDVAIRSARYRKEALDSAASRNDTDLANHEFTILVVLRQRTDQLTAEAGQCIGEEGVSIDQAAVSVTVEDIPQDWLEYPTSDTIIEVPSCGSCYK